MPATPQLPLSLPDGPVTLDNVTLPGPLIGQDQALVRTSLSLNGDTFGDGPYPSIDMGGRMVLPAFTDMHTHLDKGHIWPRRPNPDGTFMGALTSVGEDRAANWTAEDVRARMTFALECAYAHGTRAIRTHLDSIPPQDDISWGVFKEVRADWKGRIDLQAVSLVGADGITADGKGPHEHTADVVAEAGGVLGFVPYPLPDIAERIEAYFRTAAERGLEADLHVDETGDPSVNTLEIIADTVIRLGFDAPVVCGHCCSLAVMTDEDADRTMDKVARAGINIVSLPMCNLYLQDRSTAGRTPRWRGITLVHELKSRGVNVSFASDNTRDPFYAYGDLDMIEVMREATRIGHLDHGADDWVKAFTTTPATVCRFADDQPFKAGAPADLIVFQARNWNEFFSRPQTDRTVIRKGQVLDTSPPDYAVLDSLME